MEKEARPEYVPVPPIVSPRPKPSPPPEIVNIGGDIELTGRVNMSYPLFLITISLALLIGLLSGYTLCS